MYKKKTIKKFNIKHPYQHFNGDEESKVKLPKPNLGRPFSKASEWIASTFSPENIQLNAAMCIKSTRRARDISLNIDYFPQLCTPKLV